MVTFENGNSAVLVEAGPGDSADDLLDQLGLQPSRSVIVVVGGADTLTDDAHALAKRVVGPALARAAAVTRAAVVDGGTDSGIMAIVGEALEQWDDADRLLLGVAPAQAGERSRLAIRRGRPHRARAEPHALRAWPTPMSGAARRSCSSS